MQPMLPPSMLGGPQNEHGLFGGAGGGGGGGASPSSSRGTGLSGTTNVCRRCRVPTSGAALSSHLCSVCFRVEFPSMALEHDRQVAARLSKWHEFEAACESGEAGAVARYLECESATDVELGAGFRRACLRGHADLVREFAAEPRLSAESKLAGLVAAMRHGHAAAVEFLVAQPDVRPLVSDKTVFEVFALVESALEPGLVLRFLDDIVACDNVDLGPDVLSAAAVLATSSSSSSSLARGAAPLAGPGALHLSSDEVAQGALGPHHRATAATPEDDASTVGVPDLQQPPPLGDRILHRLTAAAAAKGRARRR